MPAPTNQPPPKPIVFWVIWFGIFSGVFIIEHFAAPKRGSDVVESLDAPLLYYVIGIGLGMSSLAIRFAVIPKLKELQAALVTMIVGLALAEGAGIFGMFVVPVQFESVRSFMLIIAIVCIILQAPIYAMGLKERSGSETDTE